MESDQEGAGSEEEDEWIYPERRHTKKMRKEKVYCHVYIIILACTYMYMYIIICKCLTKFLNTMYFPLVYYTVIDNHAPYFLE